MKAAIYIDTATIETRETVTPTLLPGDVLLRVKACGVCGTDVRKVQLALVKPPMVLGHEVAGDVVEIGPGVEKFTVGDRVVVAHHTPCYACHYCRHGNHSMCRKFKESNLDPGGFAEYVRIPAGHVEMTAFKIPEGVSYETAIFMEPLACILRNIKRSNLQPGDTVLILGLGSMGLLTGQLVRRSPAKVIAVDLREDRCQIARDLGFEAVYTAGDPKRKAAIRTLTQSRGVDLAVLTAGTSDVYSRVIQDVRDGGYISVFAGLAPGAKLVYDLEEVFKREITVYSSYSPSPDELAEAMEHLTRRTVNVNILNAQFYNLNGLSTAIEAVASQKVLKAIIHPGEAHA